MADRESNHRLYQSNEPSLPSFSRSLVLGTLVSASALLMSGSGCSSISGLGNSMQHSECCNDFVLGYRNRAWSARSWHEHKKCFKGRAHIRDFCNGFRQGYEDVASGKDGCTPAFPPRSYWGWKYQSPEGQAKVNAWFAGYPLGAKAAEEDGLGYYSELPMSSQMSYSFDNGNIAPDAPIAHTAPEHRLPGLDVLLSEGESIVGQVKVQPQPVAPTPVGTGTSPTHLQMPPPAPAFNQP